MKKILLLLTFLISIYSVCYAQCTPSVLLTSDKTIICANDAVIFTATPTNGGTAPTYTWYHDHGIIPGATNSTYTSTYVYGGSYYVVLESSETCANPTTVISNEIYVQGPSVNSLSVYITAKNMCEGGNIVFSATAGNGGYNPLFEWTSSINGLLLSTTNTYLYESNSLVDGEIITVKMTKIYPCGGASTTSNPIEITKLPTVVPSVLLSTDKTTICSGDLITLTATPVNGGTPTYKWRKNGTLIIPAATNSTYITTSAVNGDSYDVIMTSTADCASPATSTSNAIVITVKPVPTISVSILPDVTSTCANNPVQFTAMVSGTGATPAPTYEWFVTSSSTPATGAISMGPPSITASIFTTSALTPTSNKVYVQVVSKAACAPTNSVASNVVPIAINSGIGAGTIGSDQTICYNSVPAAITQLSAPTNIVGTPTYIWEASLTGSGPFTAIPSANTATYTPSVTITQDVYIRRVTIDPGTPAPCNVATSNTIHITVRPQLVAGIINADETICAGSHPAAIIQTTAPTGGTGIYTYQWQSENSGVFTDIAGSWSESYTPPILTTTTRFQRVDRSGTCGTVTSNFVTKTVTAPEVVTASINDPGQVCAGATVTFTATPLTSGTGQINYQWYLDASPVGTNNPTYTYNPTIADNGKMVRVRANTSTACNAGAVISNIVILNIDPCGAFSTSITGPNPITPGQQNAVYSVTNQTGFTYTWSITGGTIVGGQNTNSVTVDWDAFTTNAFARTTSSLYSISVLETNPTSQTKTTTLDINPITTGVAQSQAQSGINVFPNPTTTSFNIEMQESGVDVTYEILDITGLSVASGTFISTGSDQKINADFGAGMYQIVLKYNNVVTCLRLSKVQ